MTSIAPNPFKSILGATKIGVFYYYCPAYDNLLLLEYAALTQAQ